MDKTPDSTPLQGRAVCLTGKFRRFSRADQRRIIASAGGTLTAQPTPDAILVVGTGDSVSQRKIARAQLIGADVMTEDAFVARLGLTG